MAVYLAPKSIREALTLLSKEKERVTIISGGQVVVNKIAKGELYPDLLVDVSNIRELKSIKENESSMFIGACVTHTEIVNNNKIKLNIPAFCQAAITIGDLQVRNRATIGGTICDANLAGDYWGLWYLTNCKVWICSQEGIRKVLIRNLVKGQNKLFLKSEEFVYGIEIPKIPESAYIKFYLRSRQMLGVTIVHNQAAITGIQSQPMLIDTLRENIFDLFDETLISSYQKYKVHIANYLITKYKKGGIK
ncbi:FAD binding domain-containing protein [Bacillus cereus]|uniref:FAD binding domain-containing protein n=1 Tax=Bacillus TaxID=1386 RepID=UPI000279A9D9|nr:MULTISPECIES: FAD binding domain-containing protein [Bacillus]EJR73545.1 hypothetical protein IK9_05080 [Bacillus cereus VD166]KIQ78527.1 hypothetical protein RW25_27750 [Bacillus sp. L_1B0_8]KIQ78640.1 hypothetical protein RT27_29380 [Bacillus sp. L_1B0_5]MDA1913554.1 FAD binding domain-containing protein [Bacillus cereus]MDA2659674.1 FAD binding domain-containing protein [Bacillus cereus]